MTRIINLGDIDSGSIIDEHLTGLGDNLVIPAPQYMRDAAWFATPDKFHIVQQFFDFVKNNTGIIPDGSYTEAQMIDLLRQHGVQNLEFEASSSGDTYLIQSLRVPGSSGDTYLIQSLRRCLTLAGFHANLAPSFGG